MLRHTIDRAERVILPQRLLTIVNRQHLSYARQELSDQPPGNIVVQPCNRETGPGILLPLLHVHQRDPEAAVAVFPSDHFILEEDRFMEYVEHASAFATMHPGLFVLFGVEPSRPEMGYGWIEAGEEIGWYRGEGLYQVRRFWEKPDVQKANALYLKGYLWNTLVLAGRAGTLLELFQTLTPEIFSPFKRIRAVLGSPREEDVIEEVYTRLPLANFSRAILERSPGRLGVLRVKGVHWSDWGDEERIRLDLARFGLRPRQYFQF